MYPFQNGNPQIDFEMGITILTTEMWITNKGIPDSKQGSPYRNGDFCIPVLEWGGLSH
jgi:hypothetical protein